MCLSDEEKRRADLFVKEIPMFLLSNWLELICLSLIVFLKSPKFKEKVLMVDTATVFVYFLQQTRFWSPLKGMYKATWSLKISNKGSVKVIVHVC